MDSNPALEARGPASVFNIFAHVEDRVGPGLANTEGFHRFSSLSMQSLDSEVQWIFLENRKPTLCYLIPVFPEFNFLPHHKVCERPGDTIHKHIFSALWVCLFDLLIGQLEFVLNTLSYHFHRLFGLVGYYSKDW